MSRELLEQDEVTVNEETTSEGWEPTPEIVAPEPTSTEETTSETTPVESAPETTSAETAKTEVAATVSNDQSIRSTSFKGRKGGDKDKRERRPRRGNETKKEFEEKMLEVRRVTRVTTGGRQLSFRATMLIGNKKGKVGLGIAKGNDVQSAVSKATHDAYKNIVDVTITAEGTVPYPSNKKFRAANIKLVPAKPGTGLKAWSSVRSVLELAGFTNILSKIVGTNNILNNALLTIEMVSSFKNFSLRFKEKEKALDAAELPAAE